MPTPIPPTPQLHILEGYGYSSINTQKNFLFLGDGFANNKHDKDLFDEAVREISRRFFEIPPFNIKSVKERFTVYWAFTPSLQSGISCSVGIDVQDTKGIPRIGSTAAQLAEKNSALGLEYWGDRTIMPKIGDEQLIPTFIKNLRHPHELPGQTAIPQCWDVPVTPLTDPYQGKDYGLVIVLVNDDLFGGVGRAPAAFISLGKLKWFNLTDVVGQDPTTNQIIYDHTPISWQRTNWNFHADFMCHEIGHSHFGLGEEYDENVTPPILHPEYRLYPNLTRRADVVDANGNFDPNKIKWNKPLYSNTFERTISPIVSNYILTHNKPLYKISNCGRGSARSLRERFGITKPTPNSFWEGQSSHPEQIIGLYEGGGRFECDIYRPAGICKMRCLGYWYKPEKRYIQHEFCYICKYAIIEQIDSSLLEILADRYYPKVK